MAACSRGAGPTSTPIPYTDDKILRILQSVKVIAVVGASTNWNKPGYFVPKYLQLKGYQIIPVNPTIAGKVWLREKSYATVAEIDKPFDMVEIFRNSAAAAEIVDECIALPQPPKCIWMQLSVRNDAAAARAEKHGIEVIMNRCPKIEYGRLSGELGWYGVNSGVISTRAKKPPIPKPEKKLEKLKEEAESLSFGFHTLCIHAGCAPDAVTGSRIPPIHQTASYSFTDVDSAASLFNLHSFGFLYSRIGNPTVSVLEEKLASLEGGRAACCCASGHAAQFLTFFTLLDPGDEFLASQCLYGGSLTQFRLSFQKLGWHCHFVDPRNPENFRNALTPRCKAIFIEALANPGAIVVDVEKIAEIAHEAGIPLIVDNTMATPYLFQPIKYGADIVLHSTTKFIAGHGNSIGGCIVESGKFDWAATGKTFHVAQPEPAYHGLNFHETFGDFGFVTKCRAVALRDFGPAMAPMNAFLTLVGVETLALRMERCTQSALQVAKFLEQHPQVSWVSHSGLPSSPYYELATKYFPKGVGAVFTFGVKGDLEAGVKVVERTQLWSHLANIGDTRSLILHPASTTHRQLTDVQRVAAGAGPDVIRLSVGLEDVEDLIRDLDRALSHERWE